MDVLRVFPKFRTPQHISIQERSSFPKCFVKIFQRYRSIMIEPASPRPGRWQGVILWPVHRTICIAPGGIRSTWPWTQRPRLSTTSPATISHGHGSSLSHRMSWKFHGEMDGRYLACEILKSCSLILVQLGACSLDLSVTGETSWIRWYQLISLDPRSNGKLHGTFCTENLGLCTFEPQLETTWGRGMCEENCTRVLNWVPSQDICQAPMLPSWRHVLSGSWDWSSLAGTGAVGCGCEDKIWTQTQTHISGTCQEAWILQ